jgi:general secretion pathway protein C
MSETEAAAALAGIEEGAPATRLPLRLRGVVAASEAGLGQAVIEYQNRQDLYQVGDDLPVSGKVVLAKVLPSLVVLDNSGRYEVLKLFEETELTRQVSALAAQAGGPGPVAPASEPGSARAVAPASENSAEIAARYRDRLYDNPESLADVVVVSAVRDGDTLRGYRVMPGKAAEEFRALGFEAGDVVTAVNGLSLSEPANTMRLYQAMRSASAATFDLERNGQSLTLDVALESTGSGR